ncbi:MAG TPA: hypothetical protein VM101_12085 [Flavitalea sp.]|nr:hypothetical protein [Flavitalea sp.]
MKPILYHGLAHSDSRGVMRFVNEKGSGVYRRFYIITPTDKTIIRAWQGHRHEEKAFFAISGAFAIGVVSPSCFEQPGDGEIPEFFELTSVNNHFLRVPGGCYTGIKALTIDATLLVLSDTDLDMSKADDYRQPAYKWVDWETIK